MYQPYCFLEMPQERALRLAFLSYEDVLRYEDVTCSRRRGGTPWFFHWGRRVFDFSALAFEEAPKQQEFREEIGRWSQPFFRDEAAQRAFSYAAPRLAGPVCVQAAIRFYHRQIKAMYQSFDRDAYLRHLRKRYAQWKGRRVLDMDAGQPELCQTAEYEYEVVDLIRLMKTDWNEKALVFCQG